MKKKKVHKSSKSDQVYLAKKTGIRGQQISGKNKPKKGRTQKNMRKSIFYSNLICPSSYEKTREINF